MGIIGYQSRVPAEKDEISITASLSKAAKLVLQRKRVQH